MRNFLIGISLLFIALPAFNQSATITGTLKDSSEHRNLVNSVVALLHQKDSMLVAFSRADGNGKFRLENIRDDQYLLMVTHPYMGDYFDPLEIKEAQSRDMGIIYLTPKSVLLSEVIVKSGSPIRIKGDTVVYTADSFKVRPGANVEELLRRLPGISVDKDGQITAMGERVKKVLVDGEEFFGTDPGIATKNLRADAVKEVQVFDKKSDQAEFTGIDDGVRDKTINLKMKKLAGHFGKVELGGGLKDKYNNAAMLNFFENKRKIAGYAIMSNTGQTNLDWQDAQNYGGSSLMSGMTEDGGMYVSISNGDENYRGGRNGIPRNWNGGLHYSDKFNNDKNSINSGYKFTKVISPGLTRTYSETFLPDTSWSNNTRSDNYNSTEKHAFNLTLEYNIDSSNSLKWVNQVNTNTGYSKVNYYSEVLDEQDAFINNSTRNSYNNSDRSGISSNLLWRHKFPKLYRTLSINTSLNRSRSKSDGLLYSLNNFYTGGQLLYRDTTDQQNIQDNINNTVNTKIAYTEPLVKDFYMELSYAFAYSNSTSDRFTYIKDFNGKYEEPVDSLSNSFVFNQTQQMPGLNFRLNKKKHSFSFGTAVAFNIYKQKNNTLNTTTDYHFTNFIPRAYYSYKIKPNEGIYISYNGSTSAPSPEQLQPTRVNTDPLNIFVGNPDLKQSFRHSFGTRYNFYNVLKQKNMYISANFSFTDNAFVQSSDIDNQGKRTYKTVNTDGVYNFRVYSSYGFKIKKFAWQNSVGPTFSMYRNLEYINGVKNISNNKTYGLQLNTNYYKPEKGNQYIWVNFSWTDSKATVNTNANASYWSLEVGGNLSKIIAKQFEIGTDASLQVRQKDPRFPDDNNFTTWNGYVLKRFMKDNQLEIKLEVNDILNQNRGYSRNFSSYSFTETYYNTLKRFWLLTATWNISKNGKPTKMF